MGAFVQSTVAAVLSVLWLIVLGRVVVSWVDPGGRSQVAALLIQVTEPILAPVRRMLPPAGMIDLSAFVVLVVLGVLLGAVR
jgi:YggT family protein